MAERPVALVSRHLPQREGSAAGRALWALREGLVSQGHEVTVWSWGPEACDAEGLPDGCHVVALPRLEAWRVRTEALRRPRHDAARLHLDLPADALVVADDPVSWPAVAHLDPVVTVHHAVGPDASATGRRSAALVQDLRFERHVATVRRLEAFSARVARALGRPDARLVPIATPVPGPDGALPVVEAPVACLVADWRWPPNQVALHRLLHDWPLVRRRVTGARLLLAGRGDPPVGTVPGVSWRGEVGDSREVLAEAVAVAFPCPASSGPKVKSLEALVHGRALVTTRAGLEGIHVDLAPRAGRFVDLLVDTLADPGAAAERGRTAAEAVRRCHGPRAAARARSEGWWAAAAGPAQPGRP